MEWIVEIRPRSSQNRPVSAGWHIEAVRAKGWLCPDHDKDLASQWDQQLRCTLEERRRADAIEFLHVNAATAAHANVVRAVDCPAEVVVGRATIDTRMTSSAVIHSDCLVWDRCGR